ncbi:MAG TPA: N-methyl-L-tryptophan oxidase [Burkholderiaceae bacterium]|nr:N-methyl-L-tryptophan oxidase [Burkholderiaceae bacterium]
MTYDAIIVGLGAMGSATAFHLAQRGIRVLGLDRFSPPHAFGSSHGETRIIREAYFEHPMYVPMVQRAYSLWRDLEKESGTKLLLETGGVMIGRPDSDLVQGARRSAELHGLPHEMLTTNEVHERFPALHPDPDMVAVWEPRAGVLFADACITAHLAAARRHGAELRYAESMLTWQPNGNHIRVLTSQGEYRARQLIVTAGAWVTAFFPDLPLRIERQVLFWFDDASASEMFAPERCPVHLWQFDGRRFFYGFPDVGNGVKVAFHHGGEITTVDTMRREVSNSEAQDILLAKRRFLSGADAKLRATTVCMYTNTPDEHFWIDRYPQNAQVLIASACSGHGFKFAPVIGEVLADLVEGKHPPFDLGLFGAR